MPASPAWETCFRQNPSPAGRGWRAAPGEGSPLHDSQIDEIVGRVGPHPALRATFSQKGEGHGFCLFFTWDGSGL
jgi:hypothetical protein